MKHFNLNQTNTLLVYLSILLLLISCSKKETPDPQLKGFLQIEFGISVKTRDAYSHLKAAEPNNFDVTIYNSSGTSVLHYVYASEIPSSIELAEGSYTVVAHSNNNIPAAFENDYYYGESEQFTITAGQTQQVSVTCSLANIPVSVVYSADVANDFSSYRTRISNSGGSLLFSGADTRTGYFNEGPLSIAACLEFTDGTGLPDSINLNGSIANALPGTHYEIHIEASLTDGFLNIDITGDEDQDTVIVILNEDNITQPMTGELMITEIMYNPQSVGDSDGEYIEIYNPGQVSHNLNGLVLRRGSNNAMHLINSDVIIAPGEYAVLAVSETACGEVDYVYSTIGLVNGGMEIILNTYGTNGTDGDIICRVDYSAQNFNTGLSGSSLQLSAEVNNAEDALLGTNWCASTSVFSTGDEGTPGEANNICSN